jgi:DNA-binding MarR family transcriptional regulator
MRARLGRGDEARRDEAGPGISFAELIILVKYWGPMATDRTPTRLRSRAPSAEQLAGQLRGAVTPLARDLRQQNGNSATATQLAAMGTIGRHGPITLGELAERERVSPPMITKVVTALEDLGLVAKVTDPNDRRVCRVQLNGAGETWLHDARARANSWLAARLEDLTGDERVRLAEVIPLLERLTEQQP